MTDSTNHAHEDLDAGWDHDVPTPAASVLSLPPTPELEQIDAGWDQQSERLNPKPQVAVSGVHASSTSHPPLDTIDEGWDATAAGEEPAKGTLARGKKAALGKKDRRKLERKARVHQVERVLENREQRKAERRELAQQRTAELNAQREALRKRELDRKQQKAAKRAEHRKAKPEAKPAAAAPAKAVDAQPSQLGANAPNRAERRAKSSNAKTVSLPQTVASASSAGKTAMFGPFTIFIAVILAAALLSYFAFLH